VHGSVDQVPDGFSDGIGNDAMTRTATSTVGLGRCTRVTTRLLAADDWQDLRSARLAALSDSPHAFVATSAQEEGWEPEAWMARLARSDWAGAWDNDRIVGIACLSAPDPGEPKRPFVERVWVAPPHRRQGLVRKMLQELEGPARMAGATHLQLWVLDSNIEALHAYLKLDFHWVRERTQSLAKPDGSGSVQEHLMVRPLWWRRAASAESCG